MKIVTELYLRPMSPKLFQHEFGGGTVPRVDYHFKKLAKYGWLELIGTKSGGHRRSATEYFYRANELVIFDLERWAEVPASIRASFSLMTLEQLSERVIEAVETGTFNARVDRHLSWKIYSFDQTSWENALSALEDLFELVVEEQDRAKARMANSNTNPMLATVGFAAFEASVALRGTAAEQSGKEAISSSRKSPDNIKLYPAHLSKVLGNPISLRIIAEANHREISPTQFHKEFGGGRASELARRFRGLAQAGWLEVTATKTGEARRGATEHFYKAIGPAILDNKDWLDLPERVKTTITWATFEQLREKALQAIEAGTFDARVDRHLTWCLLHLDDLGWDTIISAVDGFFTSLFLEEQKARARLSVSKERAIPALVALTAFESPEASMKAP